ncbi:hypothetical protein CKN86_11765 [Carnobacterium divergens]|uniref:glucosaminidase domain-containing protein n=1 Tax=Carnobacterium divergens TaxID=2748 RepID=UPI000D21D29D|nr:glucosaminidase domain-containing protein [Carnobacterium divergens]MCO6017488.1 LysM peptidoglycan-binding domain-containing protein [Carnobacterium divergens]TFI61083.1 hypothetical protein CKN62_11905 [Carnobacterium divergens]TFI88105.1 hypothetical protein CKN84_11795 [Carnobacterium divergens]TFJ02673.1 hypothetical protein CKN86_11765 [Carnobacterium divergens]TFJ04183.1 hypothetical protein CKN65_11805 [Carnobacterium divergens]
MSNATNFLNQIKPGCLSLWKLYGILPSVAAAQAALESGWGSSSLASKYNNLFGIKGAGVSLPTTEYYDGKTPIGIVDSFRVYPNWNTSILDYGGFLTNYGNKPNRYDGALGLKDPNAQITAIWRAGYATDPNYVGKIMSTINANSLTAWDTEVLGGSPAPAPQPTPQPSNGTYTVQSGDALSLIAQKFGMATSQLASMNNISNPNLIYPGQVLQVSGSGNSTGGSYTVKSGDVLSIIAQNLGVSTQHLVNSNGISNPNLIYPGQVLKY